MKTITTYNGIKLILVEKPTNQFETEAELQSFLSSINIKNTKIIGTTSTLTDEQVEPFVEKNEFNNYCNYNNKSNIKNKFCFNCSFTALESFNSLLEVNNIDTSKEYVILKLLNNEQTN